jgi:hypothetical protein
MRSPQGLSPGREVTGDDVHAFMIARGLALDFVRDNILSESDLHLLEKGPPNNQSYVERQLELHVQLAKNDPGSFFCAFGVGPGESTGPVLWVRAGQRHPRHPHEPGEPWVQALYSARIVSRRDTFGKPGKLAGRACDSWGGKRRYSHFRLSAGRESPDRGAGERRKCGLSVGASNARATFA